MASGVQTARITPEQLLELPDHDLFELVDGVLVEKSMGWESSRVAIRISTILQQFVDEHRLGWIAGADAGYQCYPDDPLKVRKPDVSFVSFKKIPADEPPVGHCQAIPDLVVEVTSPNDLYCDVEVKIQEYLDAGVPLVWVVNPDAKTMRSFNASGETNTYRGEETISAEPILPNFRCPLSQFFAVTSARTN